MNTTRPVLRSSAGPQTQRQTKTNQGTPPGFASQADFVGFADTLVKMLEQYGHYDVEPILQGSAVTGSGHLSGKKFDSKSDYDVALVSRDLMNAAWASGVAYRGRDTRTEPLSKEQETLLNLNEIADAMTRLSGHDVHFMIYQHREPALERDSRSLKHALQAPPAPIRNRTVPPISNDSEWPDLGAPASGLSPAAPARSTQARQTTPHHS